MKKKNVKPKPIIFKVANEETRDLIQKNADLYAGGNMSAWLRHAAIHYKPDKHFRIRARRNVEDFY